MTDEDTRLMWGSDVERLVKELRELNPYPADVFLEKTSDDWEELHLALEKEGLKADGYFGSEGRRVWNICVDKLEEIIADSTLMDDEKNTGKEE